MGIRNETINLTSSNEGSDIKSFDFDNKMKNLPSSNEGFNKKADSTKRVINTTEWQQNTASKLGKATEEAISSTERGIDNAKQEKLKAAIFSSREFETKIPPDLELTQINQEEREVVGEISYFEKNQIQQAIKDIPVNGIVGLLNIQPISLQNTIRDLASNFGIQKMMLSKDVLGQLQITDLNPGFKNFLTVDKFSGKITQTKIF